LGARRCDAFHPGNSPARNERRIVFVFSMPNSRLLAFLGISFGVQINDLLIVLQPTLAALLLQRQKVVTETARSLEG
jgi:hypothetical protein